MAGASATTVQQAMSRRVVTVEAGATLAAAARLMHRNHVSGLPIVGAGRRLEGIVTRSDLLRVSARRWPRRPGPRGSTASSTSTCRYLHYAADDVQVSMVGPEPQHHRCRKVRHPAGHGPS